MVDNVKKTHTFCLLCFLNFLVRVTFLRYLTNNLIYHLHPTPPHSTSDVKCMYRDSKERNYCQCKSNFRPFTKVYFLYFQHRVTAVMFLAAMFKICSVSVTQSCRRRESSHAYFTELSKQMLYKS